MSYLNDGPTRTGMTVPGPLMKRTGHQWLPGPAYGRTRNGSLRTKLASKFAAVVPMSR